MASPFTSWRRRRFAARSTMHLPCTCAAHAAADENRAPRTRADAALDARPDTAATMWQMAANRPSRRAFGEGTLALVGGLLLGPRAASAGAPDGSAGDLEVYDRAVGGVGRRMTMVVPRHLDGGERVPLLVLLHGLGETSSPELGARAWVDRYGLTSAYERLRHPPIAALGRRGDWTAARLAEVNASVARAPFRGFVIACPAVPRPGSVAEGAYARWIVDTVIPTARAEASMLLDDTAGVHLGGCSLGGAVALDVFLRAPARFAALAGVQTAIATSSADRLATRIAAAFAAEGAKRLLFLTSTADPFRAANVALTAALATRGINADLRILPGPHDQPWLRDAGTLEMLLWNDRGNTP